jgi:hypothetical protein
MAVSTYSNGGSVGQRTNTMVYATNNIDVIRHTNALGVLVSSNAFNNYRQVTTNYNARGERTVWQFDGATHRLTSVTLPGGLVRNYAYYTSAGTNLDNLGFVQSITEPGFRTNAFNYTMSSTAPPTRSTSTPSASPPPTTSSIGSSPGPIRTGASSDTATRSMWRGPRPTPTRTGR